IRHSCKFRVSTEPHTASPAYSGAGSRLPRSIRDPWGPTRDHRYFPRTLWLPNPLLPLLLPADAVPCAGRISGLDSQTAQRPGGAGSSGLHARLESLSLLLCALCWRGVVPICPNERRWAQQPEFMGPAMVHRHAAVDDMHRAVSLLVWNPAERSGGPVSRACL